MIRHQFSFSVTLNEGVWNARLLTFIIDNEFTNEILEGREMRKKSKCLSKRRKHQTRKFEKVQNNLKEAGSSIESDTNS